MIAPQDRAEILVQRPVVGRVTPARGVPIHREARLSDDDIERIARRVVELLKEK